jgi:hypothetical protein
MHRYYESALTSSNPLIAEVFEGYKVFKRRKFIKEELAMSVHGIVGALELIRQHNKMCLEGKETYPTSLCKADKIIRDLILDNFEVSDAILFVLLLLFLFFLISYSLIENRLREFLRKFYRENF